MNQNVNYIQHEDQQEQQLERNDSQSVTRNKKSVNQFLQPIFEQSNKQINNIMQRHRNASSIVQLSRVSQGKKLKSDFAMSSAAKNDVDELI